MHLDYLHHCLQSLDNARPLLHIWQLADLERGFTNLVHLGRTLRHPALCELCPVLARLLPRCPDPDMALNNLERFLANPLAAQQLPGLLDVRSRTLEILLQLFSTSHFFSDLLSLNPDYLDMLRVPLRRSPSLEELRALLQADVDAALDGARGDQSSPPPSTDQALLRAFRRFRQRQLLRIGTNDIIRDRPLEEITRDLSCVADAALEVALSTALHLVGKRFGQPTLAGGEPSRCVILAFGKHGGEELNYSSDIDLMFIYDEEGSTRGVCPGLDNSEFYDKVVSEVVRLLSKLTDRGQAYRVDLRLRPEGQRGPLSRTLSSTLSYYDTLGRTWERQALIKVRPVAGDLELGQRFLQAVESFVYRRYLTVAEINEIKAVKRRIEQKASRAGVSDTEVKTGRGGIRDIEFTIQFLQLLNGGDLLEVRQRNTLLAMAALERVGCLTDQEYRVLDDAYRFLRKTEHRLQLLFDLQTHRLPEREVELAKLALRMGYPGQKSGGWRSAGGLSLSPANGAGSPARRFLASYQEKTEPTRRILDHLLHQTFDTSEGEAEPESDLILDPNPDPETIKAVLGRYPFRDVQGAYQNLTQLAQEEVVFLSTRRCRHFLASIAPSLLRALAETPDPDLALVNLEKVTHSLGAKTVLWELFSFNTPSLKLYVDLCAWSQFLSEILINNPGMIDELLDSLVLNQPRTAAELRTELADLCRGAEDLEVILHSFQDKELLRIGVRDILGKDTIQDTTAALSDLAETLLVQLATPQYLPLEKRYGIPTLTEGPRAGQRCRFALLALGKLGGQEMSYHSDLDLILIYEDDGPTLTSPGQENDSQCRLTNNFHFFTDFAQRIIRAASFQGPMGRLYKVDMRLRPTGQSGSLVITLPGFRRYLQAGQCEGGAQLWERQILTRARVVHGDAAFGQEVLAAVAEGMNALCWQPAVVDEMLAMRQRLEASRAKRDLKRGCGGLMDVEFLVEMFQLKFGRERPGLRQVNIWHALRALEAAGLLTAEEHLMLREGYDFLLRAQSRLRIFHNRSVNELPEVPAEINKLARCLGFDSGSRFQATLDEHTSRIRALFLRLMQRERGSPTL